MGGPPGRHGNKMNGTKRRVRKNTKAEKAAGKIPQLSQEDGYGMSYGPSVTEISDAELAALAWQMNPELCKKNLVAAIKLTMKTLLDIKEARREAVHDLITEALRVADQKAEERWARVCANFRTGGA
jgi:hypothetical protein